jgi:ferritin-like protein
MITKNKNFSIIDNYSEDYFRAIEFLYSLDKKILDTLDSDNQTKKNLVNKDEFTAGQNNNISHLSHMNIDDNNSKKHGQFDINNNGNNNSNPIKEEQNILDYDNDIEIKEELFEKLSKNEQLTLTSINTKFFNRNILLRDYYGSINLFNINFHPIYTNEFKKIISKSKHQFFVKVLTQASSTELTNYFFPTTNKNLEGLSKYLQQEEIQNMYKVEKTKILALLKNDTDTNKKYGRTSSEIKNMDISDIEKYQKKKELWISNIKKQLLKEENRSLHEIDQALINLYDNLNDEYKEEISKNPELILYYIFTDIGTSNCYTTTFHIRKSAIEDDFNNLYNLSNKNSTLYYNNLEDTKYDGKSGLFKNSILEDSKEENNNSFKLMKKKRNSKLYQITGIPEERKLIFSDNSNSSEDDKNKDKTFKLDLPTRKERRYMKLNSMAEVSESAEGD